MLSPNNSTTARKVQLPLLGSPGTVDEGLSDFPQGTSDLLSDLQALGMRLIDGDDGVSRTGGAGPSDHKAVKVAGNVVMVPVFTHSAHSSPFEVRRSSSNAGWVLYREGIAVGPVEYAPLPRFYALRTAEGVPYWKIATLHSHDVLATTVLQNCIRYADRESSCQFCAIGASLRSRKTIARKTPSQLAEVAKAAVALDGVKQMVLTTGTPPTSDRGARLLEESALAIKEAVELPLQGQCEPPDDDVWFERLKGAGIDSLGMHLEAVSEEVRGRIMPGKASIPLQRYMAAFEAAVRVFGRGQVSTYVLAGLGDTEQQIVEMSAQLAKMGVYPFVVPFVPIGGTPLENHPAPDPAFMRSLLDRVAAVIAQADLFSQDMKAGCAKCGACSSLRAREEARHV